MRYFEIAGGLRLPVSGEEQTVLSDVQTKGRIKRVDMSDRSQEMARRMVSRGLLRRVRDGEQEAFIQNNDPPLTRDL